MQTLRVVPVILGILGSLFAAPVESAQARQESHSNVVTLLSSSPDQVALRINSLAASQQLVVQERDTTQTYSMPDEGLLYLPGRPILPAVSRFVIVPPDKGLELSIQADEPTAVAASYSPTLCTDNEISSAGFDSVTDRDGIYPANLAEMSDPVVIRGVRLVKVTSYPVRFDYRTNSFLICDHIQAEVHFNDNAPVNPAFHPNRKHRSREFLKFLDALAINSDLPGRDDPAFVSPYVGHYLIVAHEQCFPYARPLIEWRRKCGYKVDLMSLSANDAMNENTVKQRIQERYDAYLDQELDPFDNILLLGNRNFYLEEHNPPNILNSFNGESIWQNDAKHADYYFACLEGNDSWPDVAFSRFGSGTQSLMELAVGRTLSYEMQPYMDDPSWFTRGCVYSQHWGNDPVTAWHPSIHTTARWGEELLKRYGYDDITFYENYEWDEWGEHLGPVLTNVFNAGANLFIGRSQNYYWRYNFNGVNNNHVFPFNIFISGHGEGVADMMFRTGSGNDLKGTVASCFAWGNPATMPMSYVWLEVVKGIVVDKLTLGWAKNLATTSIEATLPDIRVVNQPLYLHVKSDIDTYGDPAIKPWFGAPRVVSVDVPARMNPETRMIEVEVSTGHNNEPVSNAQVTFYDPGAMPDAPGDYLAYDDMFTMITHTDEHGDAKFIFPEDHAFRNRGTVFVTVTGDDIRPSINEVSLAGADFDPEISDYQLTETEGNGDGLVNPGETFRLALTVKNNGNARLDSLNATVSSASAWMEVDDEQIRFDAINTGQTQDGDRTATIHILNDCPDGLLRADQSSELLINLSEGNHSKQSGIKLDPHAPCFAFDNLEGGLICSRGQNNLAPVVKNVGRIAAEPLTARLISTWQDVQVIQRASSYGRISSNHSGRITGDAFQIQVSSQVVPGKKYKLLLALSSQAGFKDTVSFEIQIEQPAAHTPTGPDKYGYCCFDDTDNGWDATPEYAWVEINPHDNDFDFNGHELNFARQSQFEIGEAIVMAIGFNTNFYGLPFDHVTVASNGFIAMGNQPRITNFQNWPLDKAIGGGMGMLAPLWDDLRFGNNSWIGTYLDNDEHRLIIEWYRMRPATGDADFTFEVILYDSQHHPTPDHNQPILFQYKTVSELSNIRNGDAEWINNIPYASVGISSPFGDTGVNYVWDNSYPVSSAHLQNRRALRFVSLGRQISTGYLFGRVTRLENNEPLPGASIFTDNGITVNSDADGFWSMRAPANVEFSLTASLDGFNDSTVTGLSIDIDDTLEVDFALCHPHIVLSLDHFEAEINNGEEVQIPFSIRNDGNGPLQWRAEKLLSGGQRSPWDVTGSFHCGQEVQDNRIEGVAFAGDNFYVSGANGDDPNWIYVLNRQGGLVRGFAQVGVSNYGMKDLDWDGELIWGSGENHIYGFDIDGNSVDTLHSPINPCNCVAWDSDRNLLWVSNVTSRIYGLDRGGHVATVLPLDTLRKYGLAYCPGDPDGKGLYVFALGPNDGRQYVWKTNPDDNQFSQVVCLAPPEGGSCGGAFISREYDPLMTTFMCISNASDAQGNDRIDMYELQENLAWLNLAQETGDVAPGDEDDNSLTLSDGGLREGDYEGRIIINHNGQGGQIELPVSLSITPVNAAQRRISLQMGWNLISLNITPDVTDIPHLLQPLVEAGNLIMVKDGNGRFYRPDLQFCNLLPWAVSQGYQVAVHNQASLEIQGVSEAPNTPIHLESGWNTISYYPRQAVMVEEALADIHDWLGIAKDGFGHFYLPEYDFSNMEAMSEGNGYQIRVSQAADLVYRVGNFAAMSHPARGMTVQPSHFDCINNPVNNMSLLIVAENSYNGKELGAFGPDGKLVGAGRFDSRGRCGLAIAGEDSIIQSATGVTEGAALQLRLWDGVQEKVLSAASLDKNLIYKQDGILVATLQTQIPHELLMDNPFPNPFNSTVLLRYQIKSKGMATLKVFDLSGREVEELVTGEQQAGCHRVVWNAISQPSGIYFARLEAGGEVRTVKLLLAK